MTENRKKKPLHKTVRELFLFSQRLSAVTFIVCITLVFINSFFKVSTSYGITYHYTVFLPVERDKPFEEMEIFQSVLEKISERAKNYIENKGGDKL